MDVMRGLTGEWRYRTAIPDHEIWGPGSLQRLRKELEDRGYHRLLLLGSRSLWEQTPWGGRIEELLEGLVVLERHNSEQFTPDWLCFETADAARDLNVDAVVTVGGGSVIDWGKAVRFILAQGLRSVEELDDYVASPSEQQLDALSSPPVPQIAVPTTLSGATTWSVTINRPDRKFKDHVRHPSLSQELVVYDGELATATPIYLWSATGMKAMEHVVERMYSRVGNPVGDTLALQAGEWLYDGLRRSKADPEDPDARALSQLGLITIASTGRGVRKGLSQVAGWQLGAYGVGHGETSCVMLAHVMRFNRAATLEPQAALGRAMGGIADSNDGLAEFAAQAIASLVEELGLPTRLRDVGIQHQDLPDIAAKMIRSPNIIYNPIEIREPGQVLPVLEAAW